MMIARTARAANRLAAVLLALAVVCALVGCRQNVDLAAVAALGKTVGETQASFAELSDDFRVSCLRTVGWQRAAEPGSRPDAFTSCTQEARAARQWQAANSVVTSYVAALAALAGGNDDAGDYGLGDFAKSFAALGGTTTTTTTTTTKAFDADQQRAVAGAAAGLVNAYFKAKRRDALAPIITGADADLATIVATLEDIARSNYVTQLRTERLAVQLFFEPNIARAKPGLEALQAFAYRSTEHEEQASIDARQGAVGPYIAALDSIRTTHGELALAVSGNKLGDVAAIVQNYIFTYKPQLVALQKAFNK